MEFTRCPDRDCGAPAEILDRWDFDSTSGPLGHARTRCLHGHSFTVLAETLPPDSCEPANQLHVPSRLTADTGPGPRAPGCDADQSLQARTGNIGQEGLPRLTVQGQ